MKDWQALLAAPRFRAYWLALLCDNLGSWCVIAALPILVAERFGAGLVLVLSLGLRILPKIVLAPAAGALLRRFGAARTASTAMLVSAVLTALLPWCDDFVLLQLLIGAIGTLDVFIMPGLMSLRGPVTPSGLEMAGNTMCSVADRVAKIIGPAIGGLAVAAGFAPAFLSFAVIIAFSAIPVAGLASASWKPTSDAEESQAAGGIAALLRMLRTEREVAGLLLSAATYMIALGGLRPFLFWANREWFGAADAAWTGLLAAQGGGALIGALVVALFGRRLGRGLSAYTLTLLTGLLAGAIHLLLVFAQNSLQAIAILALAGIPEIVSTAAWFTAIQARLSSSQQGIFFTFAAPVFDLAYALGIVSAGLHAQRIISLSAYWSMVTLASTLPLVPLLAAHVRKTSRSRS